MQENYSLLVQLKNLLSWKQSKKFYAEKLGITEEQVNDLLRELKTSPLGEAAETANYIADLEDRIVKFEEDLSKGTGELVFNSKEEIKTLDELIQKCKIDTDKWEITKYVQNYWGNAQTPHYQVKAWLSKKKDHQVFQDSFIDFLSTYKPSSIKINPPLAYEEKMDGCLIINKQDAHYNKHDVDGFNSIDARFRAVLNRFSVILHQAKLSNNITKIVYIIGSDEFNSEFTETTTKGTPQKNVLGFHESFEKICEHEVRMISLLLDFSKEVEVIYVAGNHDEYVGWHLIKWLQTYFRNIDQVIFETSNSYRKYVSYGNSAMMFNHGDAIKPAKLAGIFPVEFREHWSDHTNFYIFTGDKHHELSQDFNGIKFYQIPAFSNAKSSWDDKHGYTCSKGEVTAFMIDLEDGITNIFKQYL